MNALVMVEINFFMGKETLKRRFWRDYVESDESPVRFIVNQAYIRSFSFSTSGNLSILSMMA